MHYRKVLAVFAIALLVLAGCGEKGQEQQVIDQVATLVAGNDLLSTQLAQVSRPTDTPIPLPTETPKPTAGAMTLGPATIKITGIAESSKGRAIVYWDAIGDFPSGFKVVWTTEQRKPTYPEDTSSYTSDPYSRSALISGAAGQVYLIRVCRYVNDTCDVYSDLGIFVFSSSFPTAITTNTAVTTPLPTYAGGGGGGTAATAVLLRIIKMAGGDSGKAYMEWESDSNPTKGFKIMYSKTNTTPTLKDGVFYVTNSAARSAYVDGASGVTYHYRICKWDGSTCTLYSPTFTYTFTGVLQTSTPDPAIINITSITDLSTGKATVNWTATGSFPNGFKIVYSKNDPLPTLDDRFVYVGDGSLRTGVISGEAGAGYYVRVCKFYLNTCVAYSPAVRFTFAPPPPPTPDGSTITVVGLVDKSVGKATISWTASGAFPDGFKILWSETDPMPVFGSANMQAATSSARSATVSGAPRTTYFYRVCKYTGSTCTIYSAPVSFTYAEAPQSGSFVLTLNSISATTAALKWTLPTGNDGGYKVLVADAEPVQFPEDVNAFVPTKSAREYTVSGLTTNTTYYIRLCLFNGTYCSAYSNTIEVHTP